MFNMCASFGNRHIFISIVVGYVLSDCDVSDCDVKDVYYLSRKCYAPSIWKSPVGETEVSCPRDCSLMPNRL